MINPKLNGQYESTGKSKLSKFRHATLGLVDFETMNSFTAEKLVKKGYLKKVSTEEAPKKADKKAKE